MAVAITKKVLLAFTHRVALTVLWTKSALNEEIIN